MQIQVEVNGEARTVDVEPRILLAHFVRDVLGLTGTHIGCDTSNCGACTVLLDGTPVKSCGLLGVQADGRRLTTIEGLTGTVEQRLQREFVRAGAVQCGFCTPGMLLVASTLLADDPEPTEDDVRWAIGGNLCRCTGYEPVVRAITAAATSRDAESVTTAAGGDATPGQQT